MLDAFASVAQTLLYAGVLLSAGAVLACATLQPEGEPLRALQRSIRVGAILTILAACLGLVILVLRLGGGFELMPAVLATNVGAAAGLRLSGSLLLLVTPAADDDAFGRGMQISAAALVLASFAFSGHAAVDGIGAGIVAAVHVAIAAWWIGSLIALRTACAHAEALAARLVRRFSSLAVVMIVVLIAAGSTLIITLIDLSTRELTPYVRNLAIKLGIVVLVFGLAAYNKFALTPRVVAAQSSTVAQLRRSIDVELLLISAVLAATAILTTLSSPYE